MCGEGYVVKKSLCRDKFIDVLTEKDFLKLYTPYTYNWLKLVSVKIDISNGDIYYPELKNTKDYEILFNYKRYTTQLDKTVLNWKDRSSKKYYIAKDKESGEYVILHNSYIKKLGTMYFSTEEHAKEFIKAIKDNTL